MRLSLETLWGTRARYLREQLLEAAEPEAKFRVLEHALLAQIDRPPAQHPVVIWALQLFRNVRRPQTIADIIDTIGVSPRWFTQVFHAEVGLTPKRYQRIQRFQAALCYIEWEQQLDWAGVAVACGYFDQAHFIHDFRAFSGLSPTAYYAQRAARLNHVPMREEGAGKENERHGDTGPKRCEIADGIPERR
jgi:transcriptional regulator GlxA family with amidase domain